MRSAAFAAFSRTSGPYALRIVTPSTAGWSSSVRSPTASCERYVAIGASCSHTQVVRSPSSVRDVRLPLAIAVLLDGASSRNVYDALSVGWSLDGNTRLAPSGSLSVITPSSVGTQPFGAGMPGIAPPFGSPEYLIRTSNCCTARDRLLGLHDELVADATEPRGLAVDRHRVHVEVDEVEVELPQLGLRGRGDLRVAPEPVSFGRVEAEAEVVVVDVVAPVAEVGEVRVGRVGGRPAPCWGLSGQRRCGAGHGGRRHEEEGGGRQPQGVPDHTRLHAGGAVPVPPIAGSGGVTPRRPRRGDAPPPIRRVRSHRGSRRCAGRARAASPAGRRGPGPVERGVDHRHRAAVVGHVGEAVGRPRLRVGEHLVGRLHRCPPHVLAVERVAPLVPRPRREHLVEQPDELADVRATRLGRPEALALDPLGAVDRSAQVGPVTVALEADEPEPAPLRVLVAVDRRVRHLRALRDAEGHAEAERGVEVEADRVHAVPQQRRVHELALARLPACEQRRARAGRERHARAVVAHAAALERRLAAGCRQQAGDATARPERGDVVRGAVAVVAGHAEAGDDRVHEPRVVRAQRLEVEPEPLERVEADVREEDVGAVDQLEREVEAARLREVDDDAALRAVVHLERRVERHVAAEHLGEATGRVTRRRLDLDDVRAPVGEQATGRRARPPTRRARRRAVPRAVPP